MTGREGWIQPFDPQQPGSRPILDALTDPLEAVAELAHEGGRRAGHSRGFAHLQDRHEDPVDGVGIEGEHPGTALERVDDGPRVGGGDGADIADCLGEHEVRSRSPQPGLIDLVDAA